MLAGVSSLVFLERLDRVTAFRLARTWLPWLLPAAGLVIGGDADRCRVRDRVRVLQPPRDLPHLRLLNAGGRWPEGRVLLSRASTAA